MGIQKWRCISLTIRVEWSGMGIRLSILAVLLCSSSNSSSPSSPTRDDQRGMRKSTSQDKSSSPIQIKHFKISNYQKPVIESTKSKTCTSTTGGRAIMQGTHAQRCFLSTEGTPLINPLQPLNLHRELPRDILRVHNVLCHDMRK